MAKINESENPLSLYTEDELLRELRRRDHFELSYATPTLISEMNPEAYSWAVRNGKVYDLIDEWIETYTDMADWDNLDSESLGEAAMKLGFEPED